MTYQPTIAVDFDGVLHAYTSGWQGPDVIPDPPVEGAFAWLQALLEAGYRVAISSARNRGRAGETDERGERILMDLSGVRAMKAWFLQHGMAPATLDRLQFPQEKPPAILYIDDRAWTFRGRFPTIEEVRAFRPWKVTDEPGGVPAGPDALQFWREQSDHWEARAREHRALVARCSKAIGAAGVAFGPEASLDGMVAALLSELRRTPPAVVQDAGGVVPERSQLWVPLQGGPVQAYQAAEVVVLEGQLVHLAKAGDPDLAIAYITAVPDLQRHWQFVGWAAR